MIGDGFPRDGRANVDGSGCDQEVVTCAPIRSKPTLRV